MERIEGDSPLPLLESLERRQLLSGSLLAGNGTLRIIGTDADDVIHVFKRDDQFAVEIGDTTSFYNATQVRRIKAELGGGNDAFTVHTNSVKRIAVDGGAGADTIRTGEGDDQITGGDGIDHLNADNGANTLLTSEAQDVVVATDLDIVHLIDLGPRAPISVSTENPHYLEYRGEPTTIVTSGEHYGAVMNLDFDYYTYLNTLAADGLNHTRVFSGTYVEYQGWFNIPRNTLAPAANRYITPWARSATAGYAGGGNKFDLSKWDEEYFYRLKNFVSLAERRDIIVEFTLFSVFYNDQLWSLNPMNAANNVNGVGATTKDKALTLNNAGLMTYQTAFVQKVVTELNSFTNVIFELCNEPYQSAFAANDWQASIASTIRSTESNLPNRHLISQNVANGSSTITNPNPNVDVFQYHYADPPAFYNNYNLNKPIGNNETGAAGSGIDIYRQQGWETMLSGGALYSNLDYSFTTGGNENGTYAYPSSTPGSGGVTLRRQLGFLQTFMKSIPFMSMRPNNAVIKGGVPTGVTGRAFAEVGKAYALYFRGGTQINPIIELPAGNYTAEWLNPRTGAVDRTTGFTHAGGNKTLASPTYTSDIALRILPAANADLVAPQVAIANPTNGAKVKTRSNITFQATATDNRAIDRVEFLVNNTVVGSDLVAPYTFTWTTPKQRGKFTIAARAVDTFSNTVIQTATLNVT